MSEENGTDVNDWADKNIDVRWKFKSEHKDMIYHLIELLDQKKKVTLGVKEKLAQNYKPWSYNSRGEVIYHRRTKRVFSDLVGRMVTPHGFAIKDFPEVLQQNQYMIKDVKPDMILLDVGNVPQEGLWVPLSYVKFNSKQSHISVKDKINKK